MIQSVCLYCSWNLAYIVEPAHYVVTRYAYKLLLSISSVLLGLVIVVLVYCCETGNMSTIVERSQEAHDKELDWIESMEENVRGNCISALAQFIAAMFLEAMDSSPK